MADHDDDAAFRDHGRALADAATAAIPGWIARAVARHADLDVDEVARAGAEAAAAIGPQLHALVAQDVDDQRATPLALVRTAVRWPTTLLRAAGVPPVERDDFAERSFPDDDYDLTPATFADVDPSLAELALTWGAAKAFVHRRRHAPR